jgi:hypothetical protein
MWSTWHIFRGGQAVSLLIAIDVEDVATARIAALIAGLEDRTQLHEAIVGEARNLTRAHLQEIADTRHTTAEELGADPTGFWAEAVERLTSSADANAATVSVFSPGISRVAHDVTILPTDGHEFLTIPVHPLAYGHRASELKRDMDLFVIHVGSQLVLATMRSMNSLPSKASILTLNCCLRERPPHEH